MSSDLETLKRVWGADLEPSPSSSPPSSSSVAAKLICPPLNSLHWLCSHLETIIILQLIIITFCPPRLARRTHRGPA